MAVIAQAVTLGLVLLAASPRPAQLPATDEATLRTRRLALARDIAAQGVRDSAVLAAMRAVPRHEFVPPNIATRPTMTTRCRSARADHLAALVVAS